MSDAPPTVLLVDDQALTRRPVEFVLKKKGFRPVVCVTGKEAVDRALSEKPLCILMDMAMPQMDGLEATRLIRENPETQHIPILMLTAHAGRRNIEAAFQAGATDFLVKGSYTISELLAKINRLLNPSDASG